MYLRSEKTSLRKSREQEDRSAKSYGGKVIRGSGSGREKGDVNSKYFKIENKRTDKMSLSIKKEWLDKITRQAFEVRKHPALEIEIFDESTVWVAIRKQDFLDYLHLMEERDASEKSS